MEFTYTSMLAQLNVASAHPGGFAATKKAWEHLKNYRHDCILDAGCGTGKTLEFLAEVTNSRLIGIDQNQAMIKQAEQRLKGKTVELIQGKVQELPFEDGSIDCIISESVVSFNQIDPILREYNRVLRPGGILHLIEITGDQTLTQKMIKEVKQFYQLKSLLSPDEWIESIEKVHFDLIDYFPLSTTNDGDAGLKISTDTNQIFLDFLNHHYHLIELIQKSLIGYQFLCQKKMTEQADDDSI